MSTRSTISIEQFDGSILQVYCHFDGYLEGVGETLKKYYSSYDDVLALVKRGNMSYLDNTIETSKFYDEAEDDYKYFDNFNLYYKLGQKQEYNYIFRADKRWYVEHNGKFSDL